MDAEVGVPEGVMAMVEAGEVVEAKVEVRAVALTVVEAEILAKVEKRAPEGKVEVMVAG